MPEPRVALPAGQVRNSCPHRLPPISEGMWTLPTLLGIGLTPTRTLHEHAILFTCGEVPEAGVGAAKCSCGWTFDPSLDEDPSTLSTVRMVWRHLAMAVSSRPRPLMQVHEFTTTVRAGGEGGIACSCGVADFDSAFETFPIVPLRPDLCEDLVQRIRKHLVVAERARRERAEAITSVAQIAAAVVALCCLVVMRFLLDGEDLFGRWADGPHSWDEVQPEWLPVAIQRYWATLWAAPPSDAEGLLAWGCIWVATLGTPAAIARKVRGSSRE